MTNHASKLASIVTVAALTVVVACSDDTATPEDTQVRDGGVHADAGVSVLDGATQPPNKDAGNTEPPCTGPAAFQCAGDGMSRSKCVSGVATKEACARGCLRNGTSDGTCLGTTSTWKCTGSYNTVPAADGDYYITAFGCWVDAQGGKHGDPGDNCIPSCLSQLKSQGLCPAGDTGKACEERITWFTADAARFSCGARLRIENPKNGKAVIAVAIDQGPSCTVEAKASKAALDASGRVNRELFGTDHGIVDKALVHVVEVDKSTPLGPAP